MEKLFSDISPIMGIEHNCILSKMGDVSIVFRVVLPEIFTLYDDDFETLHQTFIKAIKVLPKDSIFHKQDWYIKDSYEEKGNSAPTDFLSSSARRHFNGRAYLRHESYIILTKKPSGRKISTSLYSSLLRTRLVSVDLLNNSLINELEDAAGQFAIILKGAGISMQRLTEKDLVSSRQKMGFVERYYSLSEDPRNIVIKDVEVKPDLRIGDAYCQVYTLADTEFLPGMCGPRITYDRYSTDRTKFPISFAASLGLLLKCSHIYNQYILVDDTQAAIKKLESKRLRLQSLAAYSRENSLARDAVNDFLNECIGDQKTPVNAHFNVLLWSSSLSELQENKNMLTAALAQIEGAVKIETAGAPQIWYAGIPGNSAELPANDTFKTFAEQACCFLTMETNYRSDSPDGGIRFCDRLSAVPVYIDLFDKPRYEGITTNMGVLVLGTSGGGKSVTVNHIIETLLRQNSHCVIIDIGGSYRGLCELVGGYHFVYEEKNPIRFNPFYLEDGTRLDTEQKEALKALLIGLWKRENEEVNRSEYVALSNALEGFYNYLDVQQELFPSFDTFYDYVQNVYTEVLKGQRVKDRDFDIDNFLYVLRPYYKGGEYDYLLNATEKLDWLKKPFVLVELDNIKDHRILFGVTTMMVMSNFIAKMRKLSGVRKVLVIDEAWKALESSGMAAFGKYAYKTLRKFNGVPIVVTQELDDLISSPIIKETIIANSDIKILMDMRKFVNKFDKLQDTLGLSEKSKAILLSVNKDDREIFIELGGKVAKVFKNELPPEEYFAFTSEGKERVRVRELAEKYGSIQKAIEMLVKEKGMETH